MNKDIHWTGQGMRDQDGFTYVSLASLALLAIKLKEADYPKEAINIVEFIVASGDGPTQRQITNDIP